MSALKKTDNIDSGVFIRFVIAIEMGSTYHFAKRGWLRRKRKQIEFKLVGSTWTPIAETWYIYDGMMVIRERSSSNVPTKSDTLGLDCRAVLAERAASADS